MLQLHCCTSRPYWMLSWCYGLRYDSTEPAVRTFTTPTTPTVTASTFAAAAVAAAAVATFTVTTSAVAPPSSAKTAEDMYYQRMSHRPRSGWPIPMPYPGLPLPWTYLRARAGVGWAHEVAPSVAADRPHP